MAPRVIAIGVVLASLASTSSALDEFHWLNPLPQGANLRDVQFLSETDALAVGEGGTVLVSSDGGQSWELIPKLNGLSTALSRIVRLDDVTAVAVGDNGRIAKTSNGGMEWREIVSGTVTRLSDVSFADALHGFTVGAGVALRTGDGGETWEPTALPHPHDLYGLHAFSADKAIAVGDAGFVFDTVNGGDYWTVSFLATVPLNDVRFIDSLNGIISGSSGYVFVTDNGGATWDELHPFQGVHFDQDFLEIEFSGMSNPILATRASYTGPGGSPFELPWGEVWISPNNGDDWQTDYYRDRVVNGVAVSPSLSTIVVVGDGGLIARNVGGTWQQVGGSPETYLDGGFGAAFLDKKNGIVMGSGCECNSNFSVFLRTSDAGETWARSSFPGVTAYDVAYANANDVYAVGAHYFASLGSILKSSNGGASWSEIWTSNTFTQPTSITFATESYGIVVGVGGSVVVLENDAPSVFNSGVTGSLYDVEFADPNTVLAVGQDGRFTNVVYRMVRSIDGGQSWTLVDYGSASRLTDLEFIDETHGFAVGDAGLIIETHDAGETWAPVVSGTNRNLFSVGFANETWGLVLAQGGFVRRTFDGGDTWDQVEAPTGLVRKAFLPERGRGYLVGHDLVTLSYDFEPVPTLITSFDAHGSSFGVDLSWSVRNDADLAEFRIERRDDEGVSRRFERVAVAARSFRDDTVVPASEYVYVLVAIDGDGTETYSPPIRVATDEAELTLLPNVPNPFNPSTRIRYVVPALSRVRLTIYDVAGRPVTTLVDREQAPGQFEIEWNGTDAAGSRVVSGVYLVRIEAGKHALSRKMVLLK